MSESASKPRTLDSPPEGVSFREYRPTDSQKFFEIMSSSWPKLAESIHAGSVDWYEASSTWREVACVSGAVVGLLFGKTESDMTSLRRFRMTLAHATVYLKLLFGIYGRLPHRITAVREAISEDRQIAARVEGVDGEVTFFAVDASHRGKGIGKALMGRFVDHARKTGARSLSVYTIKPGGNWQFYERYGFEKVGSFPDEFMSSSTQEEVTAMIYVLKVPTQ